jgi:ribosomal protein S18 acetylase RimI-like enzyme
MEHIIRAAEPGDYEQLGELTASAYLDDGLLMRGRDSPYLEVLRDVAHRAAHGEVLVAVDADDRVLGGVTFVPGPGPFADLARDGEAEFRTLAVAPVGRGSGVGAALVRECIDRSRALGRRRLVLSTQPTMYAAQRVYERAGFTRAPARDWSPVPGLTLLAYELELDAGDGVGSGPSVSLRTEESQAQARCLFNPGSDSRPQQ